MTNTTKRIIFFTKFAALTAIANAIGIHFIISWFYRTREEQKKLFDEGKSKCDGTIKVSAHQKWLAIDIAIVKNGVLVWDREDGYDKLGNIWKMMGGTWDDSPAGSLDDPYHFQYGGDV